MLIPIIIILLFGFLIYLVFKSNINIISKKLLYSYVIFVGVILILSNFNPHDLYQVSSYTYFLWIVSVVAFSIGMIVFDKIFIKFETNTKSTKNFEEVFLKSNFLKIIEIFELIVLIIYNIKYQVVISGLNSSQIRIARYTLLFNSSFETLFYNYIIAGVIIITSLFIVRMLLTKQFKNPILYISIVNVILYSFIGFGRMNIFNIIMYLLTGLLIEKRINWKNINKKCIIISICVLISIIILFVGMICFRMYDNNIPLTENIGNAVYNQFNQVFDYFLGGFRMLDDFVQNGLREFSGHTFGRATFAGIDEIILYPLKGIGLEIDSFNNIADDLVTRSRAIGENTEYFNAFYTAIMNFYLDFGFAGVIIFPLLYALGIVIVIREYYRDKTNFFCIITLYYIIANLFFTIFKWNYQSGSNTAVLIILILCMLGFKYRKRVKNEGSLDS